jgi:chloramphenicol-sensitive protein RarD
MALVFAGIGVCIVAEKVGGIPFYALALAFTFGSYTLFRKKAQVDPLTATWLETVILTPLALALLLYRGNHGTLTVASHYDWGMLILGGLVTGMPLLWFTEGIKRLPLTVIGFFQYLAPSLQFLLAVLYFREPFDAGKAFGYIFVWIGLALYSLALVKKTK